MTELPSGEPDATTPRPSWRLGVPITLLVFSVPAVLAATWGLVLQSIQKGYLSGDWALAFGAPALALLTISGAVTALRERSRERRTPPPPPSLGASLWRYLALPVLLAQLPIFAIGLALATLSFGAPRFDEDDLYLVVWQGEAFVLAGVLPPLAAAAVWSWRRERREAASTR